MLAEPKYQNEQKKLIRSIGMVCDNRQQRIECAQLTSVVIYDYEGDIERPHQQMPAVLTNVIAAVASSKPNDCCVAHFSLRSMRERRCATKMRTMPLPEAQPQKCVQPNVCKRTNPIRNPKSNLTRIMALSFDGDGLRIC